ncbi:class I SAM-dependent methyltransferase [Haloarcula salina]|uniref:Class I SAM-dependent methyltransferase n=1 Tax=Haloarcula salina TaxID=1429914 RepID=A0AA41KBX3_9EURY|nr:class I SAM-dependent methyltransferase [Haloarcula salina]MBV0901735.1 class I SAM-dependent methyltransferase [Haloarcula salina]
MTSTVFKQLYRSALADSERLDEDSVLLDIGAKDGKIASALADAIGCRAIVLDIDFDEDATDRDCDLIRGDGTEIPLPDDSVDAIVSNMVFEHVPDEEALIADTARVLSDDGVFISICPNRAWPGDGHGYPLGMPWLPESIGGRVARPYDQKYERGEGWYREAYHPVWSITVRRELSRYFETVEYRSGDLLDLDLDASNGKQRLLETFAEPLELAFSSRLGRRLVEAVFPTPVYVSKHPKRGRRRPNG